MFWSRYLIKYVDHRVLNKFIWLLRDRGLWIERHSYSFRLMYRNVIIGSLHIYPGFNEAVLKIHSVSESEARELIETIESVFYKLFPEYKLFVQLDLG